MDSGNLDKRINIGNAKFITTNGIQKKTLDDSTILKCWAQVNGVSEDIFWGDNNENPKNFLNFVIRYRPSVKQGMLVEYKSNVYEILGIDDYMEQHIYITLRTKLVNL